MVHSTVHILCLGDEYSMKSICVFCGSSDSVHADYLTAAHLTGKILADRGIRLIYGGGKTGLMGVVADGALAAGGEVIGVIIPSMNTPALAHQGITRMDVPFDMHGRKARMHELADGYIALPGGFGTWDELFETITWAQTGAHEKPVGILNVRNYYDPLLAAIDHAVTEGFIFFEHRNAICCDPDPALLLKAMAEYEHPHAAVKRWMRED
jgi:uncharacterized protein (TIGR00730 family)